MYVYADNGPGPAQAQEKQGLTMWWWVTALGHSVGHIMGLGRPVGVFAWPTACCWQRRADQCRSVL